MRLALHERPELFPIQGLTCRGSHVGAHPLTEILIRHADDGHVRDVGVGADQFFHLRRAHISEEPP